MRSNMLGMAASALLISLACGCAADAGSSAPGDPDDQGVAAEPKTKGAVGSVSEAYNPPGYNPPGTGPANPPGYNPPGTSVGTCGTGYTFINGVCSANPPGYNPPGTGPANPPGYNPPGTGVGTGNPPGYNPPGTGPANPPGYNPPGTGVGTCVNGVCTPG